jgi:subtilisin-like proprotein convertase family protein
MKTNRLFCVAAAAVAMCVAMPASAALDSRTNSPGTAYGAPSGTPSTPGTIVDTINVVGSPITNISSVTVQLTLTHAWIGDHNPITLTKVGGGSIVLTAKPGSLTGTGFGNSSDFCAANPITYSDAALAASETMTSTTTACVGAGTSASSYKPSAQDGTVLSLDATFAGADFNGAWELSIVDDYAFTGGVLNSWTINVVGVPEPATLALTVLGALALIRRRR